RVVVERDRRASVTLLAYEIEPRRRLATAQARLALGEIDDVVAAIADLRAGLRDLQREEFPAIGFRKLVTRMLHHRFERNQLEDRAHRILRVRDAVPENAHGLGELFGIAVLDARIPDLGPLQDAPEVLLGHGDVGSGRHRDHPEDKPETRTDGDTEEDEVQSGPQTGHRFW